LLPSCLASSIDLEVGVNSTGQKHNGIAGLEEVRIVAFPPVHAVIPIIPPALGIVSDVVDGVVIMKELGLINCYVNS